MICYSKLIQLKSDQTAQLLNKLYENEVILREQNLFLKCCQRLELLTYIEITYIHRDVKIY